jgi:hypothetical protein
MNWIASAVFIRFILILLFYFLYLLLHFSFLTEQNIFDLLSSPQSNFSSHLFKVCFWALGEFGCELSSHFLRARAPCGSMARANSARRTSRPNSQTHASPLTAVGFSSAGSKPGKKFHHPLPLTSSTSSASGGEGRLSPKESPKHSPKSSELDASASQPTASKSMTGDSLHSSVDQVNLSDSSAGLSGCMQFSGFGFGLRFRF